MAGLPQHLVQPRTAIDAATGAMRHAELMAQDDVLVVPRRRDRPSLPRVIAARTHAERPTEHANRIRGLLRPDEGERHSLCRAKKAVAFFRMSRSIFSCRFSRRKRASSLRSP